MRRLRDLAALRAEGVPLGELQKRFAKRATKAPTAERPRPRARPAPDAALASSPHDELRESIATAAARAFVERGYEAVHVGDIARTAGIGKAKLYSYFPSKADLFVDCLDRLRLEVYGAGQRARLDGSHTFAEECRVRAGALLERVEHYRMMTNLLAQAAYGPDKKLAVRARAAMHRMVTGAKPMFDRAVAAGTCRDIDTDLLAYMTWGALLALGDRVLMDHRFTRERALEAYLDLVTHGTSPG